MAERDKASVRDTAEKLLLAGVGAVALTRERVDELADDLAKRARLSPTEARELVDEAVGRWRSDATRVSERAGTSLASLYREVGLVTRKEYEELELRLAQVEHRLRLLEQSTRS